MKYQVIMRFVPDISEEKVDKYIEKAEKYATLTRIDKWGKRKLAYDIRAKDKVWYGTAYTVCANATIKEIQVTKLKKLFDTEDVIKFMMVRSGN